MKQEGIKTRKSREFTPASIKKILNNSFYTVKLVWGDEVTIGNHEPLINKVAFGKTQAQLNRNKKRN
ncbi:hypothetical protein CJ195_03585 [Bacillus sp. UMB0899]|nr:hypothetical protein CJ195_03585 [Bacillus sp. UMB0899]